VYYGLRPDNGMDPLSRGWITIIPLQNNKMTKNIQLIWFAIDKC